MYVNSLDYGDLLWELEGPFLIPMRWLHHDSERKFKFLTDFWRTKSIFLLHNFKPLYYQQKICEKPGEIFIFHDNLYYSRELYC